MRLRPWECFGIGDAAIVSSALPMWVEFSCGRAVQLHRGWLSGRAFVHEADTCTAQEASRCAW